MDEKYKYWLVAFYGEQENPSIVHITGYVNPVGENEAKQLYDEILTVPEFQLPPEAAKDLKIAEIPDEAARELVELNKDLLDHYEEDDTNEETTKDKGINE